MVVGRRVDTHSFQHISVTYSNFSMEEPDTWFLRKSCGKKVLTPVFKNLYPESEWPIIGGQVRTTSLQVQGCITEFQLYCHLCERCSICTGSIGNCAYIWKEQDTPGPSNAKSELLLKGTLTWRVVKTDLSLKPSMPRLWPASSTSENMHYTFLRETTFRDILISPFGFRQHFQTPFEKQITK